MPRWQSEALTVRRGETSTAFLSEATSHTLGVGFSFQERRGASKFVLSRGRACALLAALILCSGGAATPATPDKVQVVKSLSYQTATTTLDSRQTLDLYLPERAQSKPPLLVFLHGGLWSSADDNAGQARAFAEQLAGRNIAVAVVRYRLAPEFRYPAPMQDVAAALAFLFRQADKYRYDAQRVAVAGHAGGAQLGTLLTLDSQFLAAHGGMRQKLAGVIGLNGVYDLNLAVELSPHHKRAIETVFGTEPGARHAASPIKHARADAPPFLILNTSGDYFGAHVDGRRFADALRARGHPRVEQMMIPGRDHGSIVELSGPENQARSLILNFVKGEPLPPELDSLRTARRHWQKTRYSTAPFWRHRDLIRSYAIDDRFMQRLVSIYGPLRHELLEWPLETFHAIDLFAYLDRLHPVEARKSAYLITKNIRNEKQFWARRAIEVHRPVIVVGIDEEKNMFRFNVFYRMLREYSWKKSPPPPVMARPLGGFIHFLTPPPAELGPQSAQYGLTENSFQFVDKDPFGPLKSVSGPVMEALTYRNGCIYCHTLRGVGSSAHHIVAATGAAQGGRALALEEYPADVWTDFVHRQEEVADRIGATPNIVSPDARDQLHRLVIESRALQVRSKPER
jgi:acetyl esterase/lipase